MIVLHNPPEFSDGGYWYVTKQKAVTEQGGGVAPDVPDGVDYTSWSDGTRYIVRIPDPVPMDNNGIAAQVLAAFAKRPRGRIRGR